MRAVVMHAPGDVRVENIADPVIALPTDAIIRVTAACICGSDLWPYRGDEELSARPPWATSTSASSSRSAQRCATSPWATSWSGRSWHPTTRARSAGPAFQSRCIHQVMMGSIGTQSEYARIPLPTARS